MKKVIAVALASILAVSGIFANGSSEKKNEIPTIKWVQIGNGMPANYDAWQADVNKYLEEKIGAHVDMEVISWGDFKTRRSVIINTNEDYDIIFTAQDVFVNDVMIGAFADITDKVKTVTPKLYNLMPESYWKATSIDGKIYGVPTYKDSSMTNYYIMPTDIIKKYNVPTTPFITRAELTPYMEAIKNGEHTAPSILAMDAPDPVQEKFDFIGSGLMDLGVRVSDETRTVVPVYEQEDVLKEFEVIHDWYNKGLINADAATLAEAPKYMAFKIGQGWSTAAQTSWGPQMGVDVTAFQRSETILTNDTVRGSINCINANSKNIDKSLQLLELLNTDTTLRDKFYYGLEGQDFEYTADKKVHRINNSWPMAGYSQGTFFNVSMLDNATVDQWEEVKELNRNATPSVMLGFTMNTEPVEDEIANCKAIHEKYKLQIITGTSEPRAAVAAMMKEMRAAGFDKVLAEAQKQVDAAYN